MINPFLLKKEHRLLLLDVRFIHENAIADSRRMTEFKSINGIRNHLDRAIGKRELNATRMLAAVLIPVVSLVNRVVKRKFQVPGRGHGTGSDPGMRVLNLLGLNRGRAAARQQSSADGFAKHQRVRGAIENRAHVA